MLRRAVFGCVLFLGLLAAASCAQHVPPNLPQGSTATSKARQPAAQHLSLTGGPSVELEDCRAVIRWDTNQPASSVVEWSLTPPLRLSVEAEGFTTHHEVLLDGLVPKTEYFYRILSQDPAGNRAQPTEIASLTTAEQTPLVLVAEPVVTVLSHDTVRVVWEVNKISAGAVRLRRTTERERLVHSGGFGIRHEATIDKLEPATEYKFRTETTDACGTSVQSAEARFTTAEPPPEPENQP